MKRRYEIELTGTVVVEIDDEITSDFYEGESILTAHSNLDRFIPGSTLDTAIGSLAIQLGVNGRRMGSFDGWADFPEAAASSPGWPDWDVERITEVTA